MLFIEMSMPIASKGFEKRKVLIKAKVFNEKLEVRGGGFNQIKNFCKGHGSSGKKSADISKCSYNRM